MREFDVNGKNTNLVARQFIEDFISVCEYIIERNPSSKSQLENLRK